MNEEKAMTEYKEQKGLFQWLKSRFEKLKERFKPKPKTETKKESQEGQELFEEDLDKVKGGIPLKSVDIEELKADLGIIEPKYWELTEEQKEFANSQSEQELSEEELDEVKAGFPIVEDDQR